MSELLLSHDPSRSRHRVHFKHHLFPSNKMAVSLFQSQAQPITFRSFGCMQQVGLLYACSQCHALDILSEAADCSQADADVQIFIKHDLACIA